MNRQSWVVLAIVTGLLVLLVLLVPQSIIFALIAGVVVVIFSRVPSRD